ncbi:toll/interleukin-1 receptor domain-containing protein [Burkholderia territorii]|uniref:toll/interleukin-1 receptor domain-containing protein n=1 Tax=Burkholderia territorii TaxID=1503055 RepID=UPI000B24D1C0|nr:toll/interleukin-1 receptor domain-containing protein [Burkholderia territorii]
MTSTTSNNLRRKCFLSAPMGLDLTALRRALRVRGVDVLVPQDLTAGSDWADEIQAQIAQANLVIGVLSGKDSSQWVLFELGLAAALGRRILLITPPDAEPIPFSPRHMLVLRVAPDNEDAIGFALDQILSAPDRKIDDRSSQRKAFPGLGEKADELWGNLEQALAANDWKRVEKVVSEALRYSGTDIVVTSPTRDKGADFAVWSDLLETLVGNPFLVEVKSRIRSREDAVRITNQIAAYVSASGSQWALLLYGDGPDPDSDWWAQTSPNVLVLSLKSFLDGLRSRTFPELVRDLRNSRVHGSFF